MNEKDRLGIADAAILRCGEGFGERHDDGTDILMLLGKAVDAADIAERGFRHEELGALAVAAGR